MAIATGKLREHVSLIHVVRNLRLGARSVECGTERAGEPGLPRRRKDVRLPHPGFENISLPGWADEISGQLSVAMIVSI